MQSPPRTVHPGQPRCGSESMCRWQRCRTDSASTGQVQPGVVNHPDADGKCRAGMYGGGWPEPLVVDALVVDGLEGPAPLDIIIKCLETGTSKETPYGRHLC